MRAFAGVVAVAVLTSSVALGRDRKPLVNIKDVLGSGVQYMLAECHLVISSSAPNARPVIQKAEQVPFEYSCVPLANDVMRCRGANIAAKHGEKSAGAFDARISRVDGAGADRALMLSADIGVVSVLDFVTGTVLTYSTRVVGSKDRFPAVIMKVCTGIISSS